MIGDEVAVVGFTLDVTFLRPSAVGARRSIDNVRGFAHTAARLQRALLALVSVGASESP